MNLPEFDGKYEAWTSFYDLFKATVDQNARLSNLQKFYYLQSTLKGEARRVIDQLQLTDSNYKVAIELLETRYKNSNLILNAHLKNLLTMTACKASSESLRQFADIITTNTRALTNLGYKSDKLSDAILVYIVTSKLDNRTRELWETKSTVTSNSSTGKLDLLLQFLEERASTLQTIPSPSASNPTNASGKSNKREIVKSHAVAVKPTHSKSNSSSSWRYSCPFCKRSHALYHCITFKDKPLEERISFVQSNHICFNCLNSGHTAKECRFSNCRECSKPHHTSLHRPTEKADDQSAATSPTETVSVNTAMVNQSGKVLLATVVVNVLSHDGGKVPVRALLDPGAEESFIATCLAKKLGLKLRKREAQLLGLNNASSASTHEATIQLESRITTFKSTTNVIVVPNITKLSPPQKLSSWPSIPPNIELADPQFYAAGSIELLLGAEYFLDIFTNGHIVGTNGMPSMRNTVFGWIVAGRLHDGESPLKNAIRVNHCTISSALEKFWSVEEVDVPVQPAADDGSCEKFYVDTVSRSTDGRYTVRLPFKQGEVVLGESRSTAMRILKSTRKRLTPAQLSSCDAFLQEYINLGHMSPVPAVEIQNRPHYYLPYHPVFKESSTTTKTRVVFNGSKPTDTGVSINDLLQKGNTLQEDLFSILLRFRVHKVAVCADIAMMYRQVLIHPDDRDFQRILLFQNCEIKDFKLNTVTYGMAPSAFLAIRTLFQLASDEANTYPTASRVLIRDTYVDDVVTSTSSEPEAARLVQELDALAKSGGFILRKWASNHPNILNALSNNDNTEFKFNNGDEVGTLGLSWCPARDTFHIKVKLPPKPNAVTKRVVLSESSKLFDPLGLVAPVIVVAKILLKRIWSHGTDWDSPLPNHLAREWNTYRQALSELEIVVPRWVQNGQDLQLHGFCDASQEAYGACVYIRTLDAAYRPSLRLLCAKTKVAPKDVVSIPRLELCAAVLLTKLILKVRQAIQIESSHIFCWSDSTIALSWIAKEPRQWKQYVANRVAFIQQSLPPHLWKHVRTHENPADFASRGILGNKLADCELWWNGPQFLQRSANFKCNQTFDDALAQKEAKRVKVRVHTITEIVSPLQRLFVKFSSAQKITRIVAYCQRFTQHSPRSVRLHGPPNAEELNKATITIARTIQQAEFAQDLEKLRYKGEVSNNSKLKNLTPFICVDGLIRVGGRIGNGPLPYDNRHPILLPRNHPFTLAYVQEKHRELLHAPTQLLMSAVRSKFWIPNSKNFIKLVIRNCIPCRKTNARLHTQVMGNLPAARLYANFAFEHTGVDFAGPITTKFGSIRAKMTTKSYISLFVCLSTKAVHIEAATSLSTEAFIAALQRFVGRRGKPVSITSDNGTNFHGAANQLAQLCATDEVQNEAAQQGILWKFIPPGSPHFGGIWEAAINSTKLHLTRSIGEQTLNFEELCTILIRIEACLNSRPLYPASDDANDFAALTPGHLLIGRSLTSLPEPTLNPKLSYSRRFEMVQQVIHTFWNHWAQEYLHTLQSHAKWTHKSRNFAPGDLVMLRPDDGPTTWRLGRVVTVYPGDDGLVRVVDVKTANGLYKRPITKIALLSPDFA